MRSGLLKRSFIAVLVLALASGWQVAPSFATQHCGMDNGTALAASGSCTGHCKSVVGDCTKATSCCGISTNLAMPSVPRVTPIDWVRVARRDDVQSPVGRQPILPPPPLTFSGVSRRVRAPGRAGLLESTRAPPHATTVPRYCDPHDRGDTSTPHRGVKCSETRRTIQALQTVKTGREFCRESAAKIAGRGRVD
jgi:hypothetical protein